MTEKNQFRILATAGHVDHGKSSIARALTNVNTDRLPEEQKRGITIELGFAHFEIPGHKSPDVPYSIGLIDVPGHENFVKNMVAGVGAIDVALLVTAADDGWMPQTEEHLQILEYLGVENGLIALTKSDLVSGDDLEMAMEFVREEVQGTFLADAPIIPTSVKSGLGLEELKRTIAEILDKCPAPRNIGKPRLSVDRAFSIRGIGTVVTGTLTDGCLRKDDNVIIIPGSRKSRVRSIQHYNTEAEFSLPGTRTALNLAHAEISGHSRSEGDGIHRGSVVCSAGAAVESDNLHVLLERSARLTTGQYMMDRPLRHNSVVRFHTGGGNIPARISLLQQRTLEPGESCLAQIRLDHPTHILAGDRFIVRDWPEETTLAGGIVLDAAPGNHKISGKKQLELLNARRDDPTSPELFISTLLVREKYIRKDILTATAPFSCDTESTTLDTQEKSGRITQSGHFIIDKTWWKNFVDTAENMIRQEHKSRPERIGLRVNSLTSKLQRDGCPPEFIPTMRLHLESAGFQIRGEFIHHESHSISLPDNLKAPANRIRRTLLDDPYNPGNLRELIHSEADRMALQFLIDSGEVLRISDGIAIPSEVFNEAAARVVRFLESAGPSTVSDLKECVNASRKVMVPLLELMDARGITSRDGDLRSVGPSATS